jgi:protein ImuB
MAKRFISVWFPYLLTDHHQLQQPVDDGLPLAITMPEQGKMKIWASNPPARQRGIIPGMVVADSKAILPELMLVPYRTGSEQQILEQLALWSMHYTPLVALDAPAGLWMDISGCSHLWGGEQAYLNHISAGFQSQGYKVRIAIADTPGAAWAAARYQGAACIIAPGKQEALLESLPPAALRLEAALTERLHKLGFYRIGDFSKMPRTALRRRFGKDLLLQLDQAMGREPEYLQPVGRPVIYLEKLSCPDPVCNASGIAIALEQLLTGLCRQLQKDLKGLRSAVLRGYRVDGHLQQITIGTHKASRNLKHLFKLFEEKISSIEPGLGIELFELEAPVTEALSMEQEGFWDDGRKKTSALSELLDRISGRIGSQYIHRYIPQPYYWPERAIAEATGLQEAAAMPWPAHKARPILLLSRPEPIAVSVALPDYPPLLFIYLGKTHKVKKADGPERIEPEWWLTEGMHRDYYCVEDEQGSRYWLFRLGSYEQQHPQWFLHGFFA